MEAPDPIDLLGARSKHDDGHAGIESFDQRIRGAHFAAEVESRAVGKADVEEHQVRNVRR